MTHMSTITQLHRTHLPVCVTLIKHHATRRTFSPGLTPYITINHALILTFANCNWCASPLEDYQRTCWLVHLFQFKGTTPARSTTPRQWLSTQFNEYSITAGATLYRGVTLKLY